MVGGCLWQRQCRSFYRVRRAPSGNVTARKRSWKWSRDDWKGRRSVVRRRNVSYSRRVLPAFTSLTPSASTNRYHSEMSCHSQCRSLRTSRIASQNETFMFHSVTSCILLLWIYAIVLGLPLVPFLPRRPVVWPLCPVSCCSRGPGPVFSVTPCWVHVIRTEMEMCGIAGVNFLAESVPESSNFHLKFQKKFPG